MNQIYDIRDQMPKFKANHFKPYEYQPYPRMMVNKETGKPFLDTAKKPVIVQDEHEEKLFLAKHYKPEVIEAAKAIDIPEEKPITVQPMAIEAVAEAPRRGRPPGSANLPKDLK